MKKTKTFNAGDFLKQNNALFSYLRDTNGLVVGAILGVKSKVPGEVEIAWVRFLDSNLWPTNTFQDLLGNPVFSIENKDLVEYSKIGDWPNLYESLKGIVPTNKHWKLKNTPLPDYFKNIKVSNSNLKASQRPNLSLYKRYRKQILSYLRKNVNRNRDMYYIAEATTDGYYAKTTAFLQTPAWLRHQIRDFEYRCWRYFKII